LPVYQLSRLFPLQPLVACHDARAGFMASSASNTDFTVWGADQAAYGPVELPVLVSWVRGERVTADTWVFDAKNQTWRKAAEIPELRMFFRTRSTAAPDGPRTVAPVGTIDTGALRRVKILADLTEEQLGHFAAFMEPQKIAPWQQVVKQGDCEDSMYLILEGEFRVRLRTGEKETILATLGAGEFFGDISLFDHGPRSADVVSNADGLLLKITSDSIRKLAAKEPAVALPFLMAVGKTLAARIRTDNKRYFDSVKFARAAA
jgi:CRP/FNR family cyclic AMP-dependent transcriptional regulator